MALFGVAIAAVVAELDARRLTARPCGSRKSYPRRRAPGSACPRTDHSLARRLNDVGPGADLHERLLADVLRNPGRRGEHIAAEIGTDSLTMRLPMKKLIADGKVCTTGQRRGMAYFAA